MHAPDALRLWLRHAIAVYGADLPVAVALVPRAAPAERALAVEPAVAASAEPAEFDPPELAAPELSAPEFSAPVDVPADVPIELPLELDALRRIVTTCRRCKLCEHRTQTVFGEGDPRARVLFVGEAPGAREDELGRPFVGQAGRLLTRIIENAMGLRRDEVYIANVNKCRPPNNRNPEPDEVAACLPFLRAQIRAIQPAVIVALGRVAAHNLLGVTQSMARLRGQSLAYDGIPVVATWHPAYLLRNPAAKGETWADIKRVNLLLGRPEVPPPTGT